MNRDHFTLEDLSRGFATVTKMIQDRRERLPIATVSFLNALKLTSAEALRRRW